MANLLVDWVQGKLYSSGTSGWETCDTKLYLQVGNFDTAVIFCRMDDANNPSLKIQTSMDPDDEASWDDCTNGTVDFSSDQTQTFLIRNDDAIPMYNWLRFKVGNASAAYDGRPTIKVLLKRNSAGS